MKKSSKVAAIITSAALVAAIGVGSTFAFLSQTSGTLTNTFTVGNGIAINLDEADYAGMTYDPAKGGYVNADKALLPTGDRTTTGNQYTNVLGGTEVTKDPVVTVDKGSTDSYVFIHVAGVDALEALKDSKNTQAADVQDWSNSWHKVIKSGENWVLATADNTADGYYVYGVTTGSSFEAKRVESEQAAKNVELPAIFETVSFSNNVSDVKEALNVASGITVKACAVQAAAVSDWSGAMAVCPAGF